MLRRQSERSEGGREIPIAILTPQEDFLLAGPTPSVQTAVMTPDIKEYRTLHSLPPVPEREAGMIELRVIIRNPGCNPSEEEIISVRLGSGGETLVERAFRLHHLEDLYYAERLVLIETPKYAQAKTDRDETSAEVALTIIYSIPDYVPLTSFVPLPFV